MAALLTGSAGYSKSKSESARCCQGSIHPRAKEWVGRRLALAARAVAYADQKVVYTGPVLAGCRLSGGGGGGETDAAVSVTIQFNETLLRGDGIKSRGGPMSVYDREALLLCDGDPLCAIAPQTRGNPKVAEVGVASAFEVQYSSLANKSRVLWLPVAMPATGAHREGGSGENTTTLTIPIVPAGAAALRWKVCRPPRLRQPRDTSMIVPIRPSRAMHMMMLDKRTVAFVAGHRDPVRMA